MENNQDNYLDPQLNFYLTEVVKWHNAICDPKFVLSHAKKKFSTAWGKFEKRCFYFDLVPFNTMAYLIEINKNKNGYKMSYTNNRPN